MNGRKNGIKVSVVEDDTEMRELFASWLDESDNFEVVGKHANGLAAIERIPGETPDVVLMDINLPGADGVECVRQLKQRCPEMQFVMVTVFEDTTRIFNALAAGATGYMLKQSPQEELLRALVEVFEGGSPMSSGIARKVVRCFRSQEPAAPENEDLAELSSREEEVLNLLSKGFLRKEISDKLGISCHTVDTYLRRIYEKLHVNSRSQAAALYMEMKSRGKPKVDPEGK